MTVKEMIECLKKFDDDEILYYVNQGGVFEFDDGPKMEEYTGFVDGKRKTIGKRLVIEAWY